MRELEGPEHTLYLKQAERIVLECAVRSTGESLCGLRNFDMFVRHFVGGETYKEIAAQYGVTPDRVRQVIEKIRRRAIRRALPLIN